MKIGLTLSLLLPSLLVHGRLQPVSGFDLTRRRFAHMRRGPMPAGVEKRVVVSRSDVGHSDIIFRAESQCDVALELLYLQDSSGSYQWLLQSAADALRQVKQLIDSELEGIVTTTSIGIGEYTDKALPYRGFGPGRGVDGEMDFCYRRVLGLTEDMEEVEIAMHDVLNNRQTHGDDTSESVYDALARMALDTGMGITQDTSSQILRVAMVMADDLPHYHGDAQSAIDLWNPPSEYGDKAKYQILYTDNPRSVYSSALFVNGGIFPSEENRILFNELYDAVTKFKLDQPKWANYLAGAKLPYPSYVGKPLTGPNAIQFEKAFKTAYEGEGGFLSKLNEVLGVGEGKLRSTFVYPNVIPFDPTPQDQNNHDCTTQEYPDLTQLWRALKDGGIYPVIVVSPPRRISTELVAACRSRFGLAVTSKSEALDCLQRVYEDDLSGLKDLGVAFLVTTMDGDVNAVNVDGSGKVKLSERQQPINSGNVAGVVDTILKSLSKLIEQLDCTVVSPPPAGPDPETEAENETEAEPETVPETDLETDPESSTQEEKTNEVPIIAAAFGGFGALLAAGAAVKVFYYPTDNSSNEFLVDNNTAEPHFEQRETVEEVVVDLFL